MRHSDAGRVQPQTFQAKAAQVTPPNAPGSSPRLSHATYTNQTAQFHSS